MDLNSYYITGKCIRLARLKSKHMEYVNDEISYHEYCEYIRNSINHIRIFLCYPKYSKEKFDDACQYRIIAHENWKVAINEIRSVILGIW